LKLQDLNTFEGHMINLFYDLPQDIINLIYLFNVDHRIKFSKCMKEVDNTKYFVISNTVNYYIRITDYAVTWKEKSCLKNNHIIRLYLPYGVFAQCTDCGKTQAFYYRGCFTSYCHLPKKRQAGYKTLQPSFNWHIKNY